VKLHFGQTLHPGCFRFHRGTIKATGYADQECYFEHPIRWWAGISFARLFIGVIRTAPTRDVRGGDPLRKALSSAADEIEAGFRDHLNPVKFGAALEIIRDALGD
jgi:hypothetical protein